MYRQTGREPATHRRSRTGRERHPFLLRTGARSPSHGLSDVSGDLREVVAELVAEAVERAEGRPWEFFSVELQVLEGDHLVVAPVVEEDQRSLGELRREVFRQRVL